MDRFIITVVGFALIVQLVSANNLPAQSEASAVERAVLDAATRAGPSDQQQHSEESYQRVYEAFTKLMQNTANNSLGNVRRLVTRLNQLVGTTNTPSPVVASEQQKTKQQEQSVDEKTDQILDRLDKVNKETDQHTLRQLNDDVNRLISTLNDSYLRNIRRVVERVNKVVGGPEAINSVSALHQNGDRLDDIHQKQPGFPGWDEIIVAIDRMQKSFAHFVRSSTRLVTSG